jgi:hypothetical protein
MESRAIIPKKNERRKSKTEEETWKEREKRLEGLLREDGDPNPKAKGDFDRFLEEMMRRNSR